MNIQPEVCSLCKRREEFQSEGIPNVPWIYASFEGENGPRKQYVCDRCEKIIEKIVRNVMNKGKQNVQKKETKKTNDRG